MIWQRLAYCRARMLKRQLAHSSRTQEQTLQRALQQVRGCRLARDLGLRSDESISEFRRRTPITD